MSTLYDFNPITPAQITREENSNLGSGIVELGIRGELGDAKQGFQGGSNFEVWTLAVAGTQLTEGVDYDLKNIDAFYSASDQANYDVYTGLQITNVLYQTGFLYITRKVVLSYIEAETINDIVTQVDINSPLVGKKIEELNVYEPISADFPYFCLSEPSQTLTSANYSTAFIDELRSRKLTYDQMGTPQTAFTGSWASLVFTLDNNASNIALIEALSKDYLTAGTFTGFRILSTGSTEYEIVGLDALARTITVSAGTPAGTEIEIYLYRVFGSTTSVRHHTEAGLATYQVGLDMIGGMRRPDQMQEIIGTLEDDSGVRGFDSPFNNTSTAFQEGALVANQYSSIGGTGALAELRSSFSAGARTGDTTVAASVTSFKYLYVGVYTP